MLFELCKLRRVEFLLRGLEKTWYLNPCGTNLRTQCWWRKEKKDVTPWWDYHGLTFAALGPSKWQELGNVWYELSVAPQVFRLLCLWLLLLNTCEVVRVVKHGCNVFYFLHFRWTVLCSLGITFIAIYICMRESGLTEVKPFECTENTMDGEQHRCFLRKYSTRVKGKDIAKNS